MTKTNTFIAVGITAVVTGLLVVNLVTDTNVEVTASASSSNTNSVVISDTPAVGAQSKLPINLDKKALSRLKVKSDRVVNIVGTVGYEVNESTVNNIFEKGKSKDPLVLLINSPGGSVMLGNQILSAMEAAKGPVYTVCLDLCASMAAIIHQHGDKRYALDRSTLMFHNAAGGMNGDDVYRVQSRLNYILRILEKTDRKIAKRAGMTYEAFRALNEHELWLDAEDAYSLKFADALVALEIDGSLQVIEPLPAEQKRKNVFDGIKLILE